MWTNSQWVRSIKNSLFIGVFATIISTSLGTLAAIGLARSEMPYKRAIMALLISHGGAISDYGVGAILFFSYIGLAKTYTGIILSHAVLGTPFVLLP